MPSHGFHGSSGASPRTLHWSFRDRPVPGWPNCSSPTTTSSYAVQLVRETGFPIERTNEEAWLPLSRMAGELRVARLPLGRRRGGAARPVVRRPAPPAPRAHGSYAAAPPGARTARSSTTRNATRLARTATRAGQPPVRPVRNGEPATRHTIVIESGGLAPPQRRHDVHGNRGARRRFSGAAARSGPGSRARQGADASAASTPRCASSGSAPRSHEAA